MRDYFNKDGVMIPERLRAEVEKPTVRSQIQFTKELLGLILDGQDEQLIKQGIDILQQTCAALEISPEILYEVVVPLAVACACDDKQDQQAMQALMNKFDALAFRSPPEGWVQRPDGGFCPPPPRP